MVNVSSCETFAIVIVGSWLLKTIDSLPSVYSESMLPVWLIEQTLNFAVPAPNGTTPVHLVPIPSYTVVHSPEPYYACNLSPMEVIDGSVLLDHVTVASLPPLSWES